MNGFIRVPMLEHIEPTIERRLGLFDGALEFETNSAGLAEAAAASFGRFDVPADPHPMHLRVVVDEQRLGWGTGEIKYYENAGMYLVDAPGTIAVADLAAGRAVAIVGAEMANDLRTVRREIIEGLALSMATYARGYSALHAAGIARDGIGVAVMAPAGTGKSTLTVAAARHGLDVFAEDAVFMKTSGDGVAFWGMPWVQRLLPSALRFFPELVAIQPKLQPNGETKLEVDLDDWFPGRSTARVDPAALVRLERRPGSTNLVLLEGREGRPIEVNWPWADGWTDQHQLAAKRVAALPLYRLMMGGSPDEAAACLADLLHELARRRAPA